MKKSFPSLLALGLLVLGTLPISIAEAAYYPDYQRPFDFSLSLVNSDIDLQTGSDERPVSLDRVSFTVFTLIEPQMQFGFITGSSNLSIDNDPLTAGINLTGYHAGLAMRGLIGSNPQIVFHARYLFQDTEKETSEQTVSLSWHEWAAGITGKIMLGQQLEISAGWSHHEVDARRRATGTVNETSNLKLKSASQGKMGIAWHVSSGGRVGMTIQRGSYQQIAFSFSRQFR